ncbi:hypothetical protein [Ferrimonas futtsuensis]|uniref:hypothetical protein n=1 Tax=Ferrimonas futtsuensis TaxID=364764 RepID=UPI00146B4811|nr:hypothetical protein [Ferrimonas futtsuensis]
MKSIKASIGTGFPLALQNSPLRGPYMSKNRRVQVKNIIFVLLSFLLFGCAVVEKQNQMEVGYRLTEDKFKDFKRYSIPSTGHLPGTPFLTHDDAFIDIFTDVNGHSLGISIAVIIHFEDWVFINSGESLVLMVDGERMPFISPSGSLHQRGILKGLAGAVAGTRIREEAHYPLKTDQIERLANAKSIELKVYGSKGTFERSFGTEHIEAIKAYYEKFILKNGIKSI